MRQHTRSMSDASAPPRVHRTLTALCMGALNMPDGLSEWLQLASYWDERFAQDGASALASFVYFYRYKHTHGYLSVLNRGLHTMATKGKAPVSNKTAVANTSFTTFVNVSVPAHMKDSVRGYLADPTAFVTAVSDLLEAGYRIGCSYDDKRDAMIASLTCRKAGDANEGKTLTAFAQTWPEAITVVLFKHFEVCNQIWEAPTERDLFG